MTQNCNRCGETAVWDVRTPGDLDIPSCRTHLEVTAQEVARASGVTKVDVHKR